MGDIVGEGGIDIILVGAQIPEDRLVTDGLNTGLGPLMSAGEVGKVFFGRSAAWMRTGERDGLWEPPARSDTGIRTYTLADVERIGHALTFYERMSPHRLYALSVTIQMLLVLHGYLCHHLADPTRCPQCAAETKRSTEEIP